MESTVRERYENEVAAPPPEWQMAGSGTQMVRKLRGVELFVKYSEHYCNGNVSG